MTHLDHLKAQSDGLLFRRLTEGLLFTYAVNFRDLTPAEVRDRFEQVHEATAMANIESMVGEIRALYDKAEPLIQAKLQVDALESLLAGAALASLIRRRPTDCSDVRRLSGLVSGLESATGKGLAELVTAAAPELGADPFITDLLRELFGIETPCLPPSHAEAA